MQTEATRRKMQGEEGEGTAEEGETGPPRPEEGGEGTDPPYYVRDLEAQTRMAEGTAQAQADSTQQILQQK